MSRGKALGLAVLLWASACSTFAVPVEERAGVEAPTITAVQPARAPAGSLVAISGSFFGPTSDPARSRVLIGAQDAPVVGWSGRMIVVRIPAAPTTEAVLAPAAATVSETRLVVVVDDIASNPAAFERIDYDAAFAGIEVCENGACGFECSLDAAAFAPCLSPVVRTGLADGAHSFAVRITGPGGYVEPASAVTHWTVDTIAPNTNFLGGPTGTVDSSAAVFVFACDEPVCTYECRIDGGDWQVCETGVDYGPIAAGAHTIEARARDAAGNVDPTPAARDWTVPAPGIVVTDLFSTAATGFGERKTFSANVDIGVRVAVGDDYNDNGSRDVLAGGTDVVMVVDGDTATQIGADVTTAVNGAGFGYTALIALSDVDGDGIGDFAVGAPDEGTTGKVYVFSGGDRSLAYSVTGACVDDRFGAALAQGDDLDGDGIGELVVGAPGISDDLGTVYVLAADNGAVLSRVQYNGAAPAGCGGEIVSASLIGGKPPKIDAGTRASGGDSIDAFGASLAILGDLNGDGRREIAVQDNYNYGYGYGDYPRVFALSGAAPATTLPTRTVFSDPGRTTFGEGHRAMADAGDHNGDGTPEFWVGDRSLFAFYGSDGYGAAHLIDGRTGELLLEVFGDTDNSGSPLMEYFGAGIVPAPDMDRDGRRDWFMSDHDSAGPWYGQSNYVFAVSADAAAEASAKLARLAMATNWTGFASDIDAADIDGDGVLDLVVGEPYAGDVVGTVHIVRTGTVTLAAAGSMHPPKFRLSGDGAASFEFRVDGGTWQPVPDPEEFTVTGLSAGMHTIEVRALSAGGIAGAAQALNVGVDLTPPTVAITGPVTTETIPTGPYGDEGIWIYGDADDAISGGIGGTILGVEFAIYEEDPVYGSGSWWAGNQSYGAGYGQFGLANQAYQFVPSGKNFVIKVGRGAIPCDDRWIVYVRSRDGALNASQPATIAVRVGAAC